MNAPPDRRHRIVGGLWAASAAMTLVLGLAVYQQDAKLGQLRAELTAMSAMVKARGAAVTANRASVSTGGQPADGRAVIGGERLSAKQKRERQEQENARTELRLMADPDFGSHIRRMSRFNELRRYRDWLPHLGLSAAEETRLRDLIATREEQASQARTEILASGGSLEAAEQARKERHRELTEQISEFLGSERAERFRELERAVAHRSLTTGYAVTLAERGVPLSGVQCEALAAAFAYGQGDERAPYDWKVPSQHRREILEKAATALSAEQVKIVGELMQLEERGRAAEQQIATGE